MNWYALHIASCSEAIVQRKLGECGVEAYYPSWIQQSKRKYRPDLIRPFFPGYVFGRFSFENRASVLLPQVIRILGCGSGPVVIPDIEIASIRTMVSQPAVTPCPFVERGNKVRIKWGPFAGVEGVVIRLPKNKFKLVVSIEFLGRSICSEIDAESVELLEQPIAA